MNRIYFSSLSLTVLILFSFNNLYSQETKKVAISRENEEYFVLKSDKKIRHGEYKKIHPYKPKIPIITGQYENNKKVGVWDYFDLNGNITQRFDYTNGQPLAYQTYSILGISKVLSGESIERLSCPPLYLDGERVLFEWIAKSVKYPAEATKTRTTGTVLVYFTIDKSGKTKDYHVKESHSHGLDEAAINAVKNIPADLWFPGILDNKPVEVEIFIPIDFSLK